MKNLLSRIKPKLVVLSLALFIVLIPAIWMYWNTGEDITPNMTTVLTLLITVIAGLEGLDKAPEVMEKYKKIKEENKKLSERVQQPKENNKNGSE